MEQKLKELMLTFIGRTQNKSAEEVSSLLFKKEGETEVLKEDALNALLDVDKTRIQTQTQKFETEKKELYDKGYNKAKAESLSKYEQDMKEKFQITEDKKGPELWESIASKLAKESGAGEVTEDQVKRSKVYLDTVDALKKEREKIENDWKTKYEGREKQLQREATFNKIAEDALSEFEKLNPVLPEDPNIAKEWKQIFIDRIKQFDYEIKEDGKKVILKKEGDSSKVHVDDHGHPVAFEALVKQTAGSLFTFKKGQERQGTGNNNNGNNGGETGKGYTGPIPKNEAEYNDMISKVASESEGIALTQAWVSSQTK